MRKRGSPKQVLVTVAIAGTLALIAGSVALAMKGDAPPAPFETDVTYSGMARAGEPEIAVDPKDPDHIVLTAFEAIATHTNPMTFAQRATAPDSSWCGVQFSDDAGNGWSNEIKTPQLYTEPASSPFHPGQVHNTATDCMTAWAPDGTIYVGSATFAPEPAQPGQASLGGINFPLGGVTITSTNDLGQHFTQPTVAISSEDLPGLLARGLTPSQNGFANPYDRPWLRVDQSNGDVYVAATGHPQYYVVVSHDHGQTWSRPEALDCDETTPPSSHEVCGTYPESGGALIDVSDRVLSAAYIAKAAPGATCPCAIFETSTDAGAHWTRHVVADSLPAGSSVQVAQDDKNRFAVSVLLGTRTELDVYTSHDAGKSWDGPSALGQMSGQYVINRPWISYAQHGDALGVFWRVALPPFVQPSALQPGTQNVYAALARDGRNFSDAAQINAAPSPPPDPAQIALDDTSFVALDGDHLYAAWGDWRPTVGNPRGDVNAWFGRVAYDTFGKPGPHPHDGGHGGTPGPTGSDPDGN